ncbi:hypothetical protein [uncultured Psychrobacillus sp.]|uniref:hypothetical protein n=1 Tax=uncultured Psychrobacillus sp. TaxID=1551585 RepID=UPI002637B582|nr:hypothetical protein [uncultured Psychrobacillus sp.]
MKKISMYVFIIFLMLMLASCQNNSGFTFKGEGVNWNGELITKYDFLGKEIQSIKITYKGETPELLSVLNLLVESSDFLTWGKGEIELDKKGIYYGEDVFELETKTPSSSQIILTIDGEESESITLISNS